jgi:hypothetical protein
MTLTELDANSALLVIDAMTDTDMVCHQHSMRGFSPGSAKPARQWR